MIYFDNAATTQINNNALADLIEKSKSLFGNASTNYSLGVASKRVLEEARSNIAKLLSCDSKSIFFTSGGTESNNIIIQSFFRNYSSLENIHIICSSIEHKSILKVLECMTNKNIKISYVLPNANGIITPESVRKEINQNTKLICVQYINNELGTVQPINEIAKIAKGYNILIHVDAVQAVGHVNIDINKLGIDSLSASAHKFGGPKGIGFLYSNNKNIGLCFGGGQEQNVKSGTENVPAISSMSVALSEALLDIEDKQKYITSLINYLKNSLSKIKYVKLNVDNKDYTSMLNFRITGVSNEALVNYLDLHNICVATGSACSGNSFSRSYVLRSIGMDNKAIDSSIRVSLSYLNTLEECNLFIDNLRRAISLLKK